MYSYAYIINANIVVNLKNDTENSHTVNRVDRVSN